jgi:hypothetical protein
MERFQNTDKPLSSLMDIRKTIQSDDNSTDVKFQSKRQLEGLNGMIIERQHSIQRALMIKNDINGNIVSKLEKLLSKKFRLNQQDYIILIDRFNLKHTNITRKTIVEMINLLNMQKIYDDDQPTYMPSRESPSDERDYNTQSTILSNEFKPNDISKETYLKETDLKETDLKDTELKDTELKGSFDDRLQELINSRHTVEVSIPNNTNDGSNSESPIVSVDNTIPPHNTSDIVNNIAAKLSTNVNTHIPTNIPTNIPGNIPTNIPTNIPGNIPAVIDEINNATTVVHNRPSDLEASLHKILANMTSNQEPSTKEFNIMANIINNPVIETNITSNLQFDLNYAGKRTIDNIVKIELVSCFVNENFYKKNDLKNSPYFLMKICEFNDILYLNGSSVGGFCQIIWEKKGNYYNYINTDKLFGVYVPPDNITLDTLNIELYNHMGNKLSDIKSTENDQFNLVLKIITRDDI